MTDQVRARATVAQNFGRGADGIMGYQVVGDDQKTRLTQALTSAADVYERVDSEVADAIQAGSGGQLPAVTVQQPQTGALPAPLAIDAPTALATAAAHTPVYRWYMIGDALLKWMILNGVDQVDGLTPQFIADQMAKLHTESDEIRNTYKNAATMEAITLDPPPDGAIDVAGPNGRSKGPDDGISRKEAGPQSGESGPESEKRRNPQLSPDEDLYKEACAWTESVVGRQIPRQRRKESVKESS